VRQKGERIGRNPKTGEEVPILPRKVLVFRPSQLLKARIRGESIVGMHDEENEDAPVTPSSTSGMAPSNS
jgi:integration host factor subunit alpha